jgi:hypothetical protein
VTAHNNDAHGDQKDRCTSESPIRAKGRPSGKIFSGSPPLGVSTLPGNQSQIGVCLKATAHSLSAKNRIFIPANPRLPQLLKGGLTR